MALMVAAIVTMACTLVYWGIYTLRTGYYLPASVRSRYPIRPLSRFQRVGRCLVCSAIGVGMLAILLDMARQGGPRRLFNWVSARAGLLSLSAFFLVGGVLYLWRPESMLRVTFREYPEIVENRALVAITRGLGVAFAVAGAAGLYLA